MTNLLVMKFGGTSMGSAERIRVAAQICADERARRPVVAVVSAMSKVTDLLLNTLRHAEAGDRPGIESNLERLAQRHLEACDELLEGERREQATTGIRKLIADFGRIAHGMLMLGERPPRSVDEAIAIGERLSALLIAEYLESTGIPARAIKRVLLTAELAGSIEISATSAIDVTARGPGGVSTVEMMRVPGCSR